MRTCSCFRRCTWRGYIGDTILVLDNYVLVQELLVSWISPINTPGLSVEYRCPKEIYTWPAFSCIRDHKQVHCATGSVVPTCLFLPCTLGNVLFEWNQVFPNSTYVPGFDYSLPCTWLGQLSTRLTPSRLLTVCSTSLRHKIYNVKIIRVLISQIN